MGDRWANELSSEICCGTDYAYEMLSGLVAECQRLGLSAVQADQIVGGGQPACYSTKHKHPPGPGRYQYENFHKIFSRILEEGRQRDPDFAWSLEEPGELYIQDFNFYHARDCVVLRGYPPNPGYRGIPLFTYLYHEYALGYGGDMAPAVFSQDGPDYYSVYASYGILKQGINLICGKFPAMGFLGTDSFKGLYADDLWPPFQTAMKGVAAIMRSRALKYLMTGRMLHPLELQVPRKARTFWYGGRRHMDFPSVLDSVYEAPDGSGIGYVFFNWTNKEVRFQVPLASDMVEADRYDIWKYGKGGSTTQPWKSRVPLPQKVELTLGQGESVFLEIVPHDGACE